MKFYDILDIKTSLKSHSETAESRLSMEHGMCTQGRISYNQSVLTCFAWAVGPDKPWITVTSIF